MRKLNEFFRALSSFLADPAGHVGDAWSTVKNSIDSKSVASDKVLRNAITTIDNAVSSVVYFLKSKVDEPTEKDPDDAESKAS